jgi:Fe(3+) dicitrate transport protein
MLLAFAIGLASAPPPVSAADRSPITEPKEVDIAAQPLESALHELGSQTDVQIIFDRTAVEALQAPALKGRFTAEAALDRMLSGTGLRARVSAPDTFSIEPIDAAAIEPRRPGVLHMPRVDIVGDRPNIAGSAEVIDHEVLEESRVFNVAEALRKVPGVNVREEEGFGLRPNVGIRGLNPTRSTKITLLEDGVPLAYAPYGDNASYFHPPIDRFEEIEVLKGAEQLFYGPQTIGGVINYITPEPPEEFQGFASVAGGNRSFFDGRFRVGYSGLLFDFTRKQGDGARENINTGINDINLKWVAHPTLDQGLTLRANVFMEDSEVTYSGLTQAEFERLGPRYNPFKNDRFEASRYAGSVTHEIAVTDSVRIITNGYFSNFNRDWWRQASTTTDGQCGPEFTAARMEGERVNADACRSIQGRLRKYYTGGFEPRLAAYWDAFGVNGELLGGFKAQYETQDREQVNGTSPTARSGTTVEDNLRQTQAYSFYLANRFAYGPFSVIPILRFEHIDNSRKNRLTGDKGSDTLSEWIPGFGVIYEPHDWLTLFTDVHRGFAPPRTEDVIDGVGTSTDVGPEESINFEFGLRARPWRGAFLHLTYFRNDFQRLIAVGSIAAGSTPLAEGKALFEGFELLSQIDLPYGFYFRPAVTWLPTAKQVSPFRRVVGGEVVPGSKAGNRQPYAPEALFTGGFGYRWQNFDGLFEVVTVGSQYADFANTTQPTPDGQRGKIPSYTIMNLALNYHLESVNSTLFVTAKNLADSTYIVDRTRGIQVGMPLLVFGGLKHRW